jgi:hypothetical protein
MSLKNQSNIDILSVSYFKLLKFSFLHHFPPLISPTCYLYVLPKCPLSAAKSKFVKHRISKFSKISNIFLCSDYFKTIFKTTQINNKFSIFSVKAFNSLPTLRVNFEQFHSLKVFHNCFNPSRFQYYLLLKKLSLFFPIYFLGKHQHMRK